VINFRYHVVSLTAVFLSLAVGLVLGSTVLNGPMLDGLESRVNTMTRENSQLREQVGHLEEEVNREQVWATEVAPHLLSGALTGRRVGLLVTPSGEEYVEGVLQKLELADASVTGTLSITDKFTHPQHRLNELLDLSQRSLPISVDGDALPHNSDGVETSAALLAAVLFDHGPPVTIPGPDGTDETGSTENGDDGEPEPLSTVPADDRRTVLAAYTNLDYLEREDWEQPAELIVVVTGLPVSESDADERNDAILTTVTQFGLTGPVVVAGVGQAGDGNVVTGVRTHPELADTISTVDNAGTPQGQVTTGLAVVAHLTGDVGHYGSGDRAESMVPELSFG
jgi:hypothetical protein